MNENQMRAILGEEGEVDADQGAEDDGERGGLSKVMSPWQLSNLGNWEIGQTQLKVVTRDQFL